jgi:hypothetical protein
MSIAGFRLLTVICVGSALISSRLRAEEPKKDDGAAKKDEHAKELAVRFMKAVNAKDIDAMMKMADVPWYDEPGRPLVIKDRRELEGHLKKQLDDVDPKYVIPTEVVRVFAYGPFRKKNTNKHDEEFFKAQDQVFADGDRVLIMENPKSKQEGLIVGVRFRDGKPLVCGLFK